MTHQNYPRGLRLTDDEPKRKLRDIKPLLDAIEGVAITARTYGRREPDYVQAVARHMTEHTWRPMLAGLAESQPDFRRGAAAASILTVLTDMYEGRISLADGAARLSEAVSILRGNAPAQKAVGACAGEPEQPGGIDGVDDLVNLDEAAAIVHRSKRTLERLLSKMPAPYIQGGGGKPSLWKWAELRPWLEKEYVPDLPQRFPRNVR